MIRYISYISNVSCPGMPAGCWTRTVSLRKLGSPSTIKCDTARCPEGFLSMKCIVWRKVCVQTSAAQMHASLRFLTTAQFPQFHWQPGIQSSAQVQENFPGERHARPVGHAMPWGQQASPCFNAVHVRQDAHGGRSGLHAQTAFNGKEHRTPGVWEPCKHHTDVAVPVPLPSLNHRPVYSTAAVALCPLMRQTPLPLICHQQQL